MSVAAEVEQLELRAARLQKQRDEAYRQLSAANRESAKLEHERDELREVLDDVKTQADRLLQERDDARQALSEARGDDRSELARWRQWARGYKAHKAALRELLGTDGEG